MRSSPRTGGVEREVSSDGGGGIEGVWVAVKEGRRWGGLESTNLPYRAGILTTGGGRTIAAI